MNYDFDIFSYQFPLAKQLVYHITYYHQLHSLYARMRLKSEFWTHTIDAHLLQATIVWCMLFGSHGSNPSHWKKLTQTDSNELQRSFREGLFRETSLDKTHWDSYWKNMVRFRNEFAAHRESPFQGVVPDFGIALEVAFFYDRWIREVISPVPLEEPSLHSSAKELKTRTQPLLDRLLQDTQQYNQDTQSFT